VISPGSPWKTQRERPERTNPEYEHFPATRMEAAVNGEAAIPQSDASARDAAPWRGALALPATFVDAGDVSWSDLEPLLAQGMIELRPGEVMEVQSGDPATLMALPGWCAGEGHTLIHAHPGDGHVSFWIGKNA
jgi:TusA-related sulfurtransferase